MRTRIIGTIVATTLAISSSGLRAEPREVSPAPQSTIEEPAVIPEAPTDSGGAVPAEPEEDTPPADQLIPAPEPREVGAASTEAAQAARTRRWQNYAIAGLAIAVAGVAIYLASINGGHHAKQ